jgi:cobalt-zinc-cadmium efflux system protein
LGLHDLHQSERRFGLALVLVCVTLVAEVGGGLWTGSLALLSDAAHVFLDILALAMSYAAVRLSARPADGRHTYGFHRLQVLAALANGATLVLVSLGIFREVWLRLRNPEPVLAGPMLVIALVSLTVNVAVALVLHTHDRDDLNTQSAFLHALGDALSSIGVIVAGLIILFTGWLPADPMISVIIGIIIVVGSVRVLRQSVHILAEGTPEGITPAAVGQILRQVPGVTNVHDLHIWTVSPGYVALSAHVVLGDQSLAQVGDVQRQLRRVLQDRYGIEHTTIQVECDNCGQGAITCHDGACN